MDKKEKTGVLNVRDLVNVGLFSVLIFIATFLSGMIGFIPVLMPVVPFVYGIVSGPVYMLYFTKIKKSRDAFHSDDRSNTCICGNRTWTVGTAYGSYRRFTGRSCPKEWTV